jgi:hypothetical protein
VKVVKEAPDQPRIRLRKHLLRFYWKTAALTGFFPLALGEAQAEAGPRVLGNRAIAVCPVLLCLSYHPHSSSPGPCVFLLSKPELSLLWLLHPQSQLEKGQEVKSTHIPVLSKHWVHLGCKHAMSPHSGLSPAKCQFLLMSACPTVASVIRWTAWGQPPIRLCVSSSFYLFFTVTHSLNDVTHYSIYSPIYSMTI